MAWRIHDSILRGEIDNRERGLVRGRLWLQGTAEPIALELKGNAAPDLAGCLLSFENPGEKIPLPLDAHFDALQKGAVGDFTASRKVRVPDVPVEEFMEMQKQGKTPPEHMANSLYLEWFSEANGRVVVESADYKLTISPPAWRLTPEEEQQRQRDAAQGFAQFMDKLSAALDAAKHQPPEDKEWDEFDYEKFLREGDARTDKYMELLDKYMDHPDRERIISEEMGWAGMDEADFEEDEEDAEAVETESAGAKEGEEPYSLEVPDDLPMPDPDPATEGVDWVRDEDGDVTHPLSLRAFNASMTLWHKCDDLGVGKADDDDLHKLISEFQITSAKLAGALDSLAYGRHLTEGPFIVAYLKRALSHLHAAQAALEQVATKNLLPADTITATRKDLFSIREEILRLMEEFRSKK